MNCFRPRFSVRTLAIFVMLVCSLLGGWHSAKNASNASVNMMWRVSETKTAYVAEATSPAPFLIACNECEERINEPENALCHWALERIPLVGASKGTSWKSVGAEV
jgi:hypothetical protein